MAALPYLLLQGHIMTIHGKLTMQQAICILVVGRVLVRVGLFVVFHRSADYAMITHRVCEFDL